MIDVLGSATGILWLAVATLQAGVTALVFSRTRAIAPTVFALGFVLLVPVLGAVNALSGHIQQCDTPGATGAALATTVYIVLFLGITMWASSVRDGERWFPIIQGIPATWIFGVVCLWAALKIYLIVKYGFEMLLVQQAEFFEEIPLAYWETIGNSLVKTLLVAVTFLTAMRIALGIERPLIAFAVGTALVGHLVLGDADTGARRTLVALAIVYFVVRWLQQRSERGRWLRRVAFSVILLGVLGVYYTYIRSNIFDPDIQAKLLSGSVLETLEGTAELFVPETESIQGGAVQVVREGPIELLCRISETQWNKGTLSGGDVLAMATYRSMPRVLFENKQIVEPDVVIADTHNLYPTTDYRVLDLATSTIAQLQSDFGILGWILAPTLHAIGVIIYCYVFSSKHSGTATRILALGGLWGLIGSAETTLTTTTSGLRDFLLFVVLVESGRYLWKAVLAVTQAQYVTADSHSGGGHQDSRNR